MLGMPGNPTTLEVTDADTYDHLITLRKAATDFMAAGCEIKQVNKIDQLKFCYLGNYIALKNLNAKTIYQEIEFK
jgi:hypothetical protein